MSRFEKFRLTCLLVVGIAGLVNVANALYHWGWTDGFRRAVEITDEVRSKP